MIIFGTRGVTYSAGSGDFYCPQCQSSLPYRHRRVRRFFTLYFIPLIPLNLHGEYIECQQCRGTYRLDVLNSAAPAQAGAGAAQVEAEFHQAVKRVMVQMMLADGEIDEEEINVIRRLYAQLTKRSISDEDIQLEIGRVKREGQDVAASLQQCAGYLNDGGKEMVVKAAFLVAAADGQFQEEEKAMLVAIGQALNMTTAHLRGVVSSMAQSS